MSPEKHVILDGLEWWLDLETGELRPIGARIFSIADQELLHRVEASKKVIVFDFKTRQRVLVA